MLLHKIIGTNDICPKLTQFSFELNAFTIKF